MSLKEEIGKVLRDPPEDKLKELIIEKLREEEKPILLSTLIDALIYEGYSQEDIEKAIDELEQQSFVKKDKIKTLYGEETIIELIREPELKLKEFIEEEEVVLTPSEKRMLEVIERTFGIENPEIVKVNDTNTALIEYKGERINIAIGEIEKPELFEPISLEGRIWYVKKSTALERLKRKIKGEEEREIKQPTATITEYGALRRYEQIKEALEFLKTMRE